MPSTLQVEISPSVESYPLRKAWTRSEIHSLEASGLLEGQRLELIAGELIVKMGKNRPHTIGLWLLLNYLVKAFSLEHVQQEAPIDVHPEDVPTSEPEPDLIVLKDQVVSISIQNPRPSDLNLVCEVSDSTLAFDLTKKASLYARAGIVEYWVLDLINKQLIVHRTPAWSGYQSIQAYAAHESVAPLAAPQFEVEVASLFA